MDGRHAGAGCINKARVDATSTRAFFKGYRDWFYSLRKGLRVSSSSM
jgi:hypothetical protein